MSEIKPVALVTGAGRRRVGSFIAEALAGRGYRLAIHYHTAAAEAIDAVDAFRARGIEAMAVQADLSDEERTTWLVQEVLDRFGRIDVLVNCASLYRPRPLEQTTAEDVRRHFDANILATFLCSKLVGLAMVKQASGGCIVNFGDWAEARPYKDYAAYFATKGGVPAMTRCFAVELGTRNSHVRVNCIVPGPVLFPSDLPEEERRQSVQATLVQHAGHPENVAQAVLLAIDNNFMTGASLVIDGGRTIYACGA